MIINGFQAEYGGCLFLPRRACHAHTPLEMKLLNFIIGFIVITWVALIAFAIFFYYD